MTRSSEADGQGFALKVKGFRQKVLVGLFPKGNPLSMVNLLVEKGKEKFSIVARSQAEVAAKVDFLGNLDIGNLRLWLDGRLRRRGWLGTRMIPRREERRRSDRSA